jgi:hypothetical protein
MSGDRHAVPNPHQLSMFNLSLALNESMIELAGERQVFHSEADFQHAVAWLIHGKLPKARVSLERPWRTVSGDLHIDMLVQQDGMSLAVELKYKTAKLKFEHCGEHFALANHGAQDLGRYDYLKDICRLEAITNAIPRCTGWAIMLTNDAGYWSPRLRQDTIDAAFRIECGTVLHGAREWASNASEGTKRGRTNTLTLNHKYDLQWQDFSNPFVGPNGKFRFVGVVVPELPT